ncbi:MAG: hypothetical protein NWR21_04655 [Verrucomicrobiales bacterium]|jgi:hypothetical protein|nr:hypothetical protein [Verrucomicrobiales bacterium]MDP4938584.1 hypothetical protein [Verrucomicrobiales bacterium]
MKRKQLTGIILAAIALISGNGCIAEESDKKHVVFLVGDDLNHASGTHEFYAGAILLKQSLANSQLKEEVTSTVVNNWLIRICFFNPSAPAPPEGRG